MSPRPGRARTGFRALTPAALTGSLRAAQLLTPIDAPVAVLPVAHGQQPVCLLKASSLADTACPGLDLHRPQIGHYYGDLRVLQNAPNVTVPSHSEPVAAVIREADAPAVSSRDGPAESSVKSVPAPEQPRVDPPPSFYPLAPGPLRELLAEYRSHSQAEPSEAERKGAAGQDPGEKGRSTSAEPAPPKIEAGSPMYATAVPGGPSDTETVTPSMNSGGKFRQDSIELNVSSFSWRVWSNGAPYASAG